MRAPDSVVPTWMGGQEEGDREAVALMNDDGGVTCRPAILSNQTETETETETEYGWACSVLLLWSA